MACRARINVGLFKELGQQLEFVGGYVGSAGPTLFAKLRGNNQGRVRSHFERLISIAEIEALREEGRACSREQTAMAREEEFVRIYEEWNLREHVSVAREYQDAQAPVANTSFVQDV